MSYTYTNENPYCEARKADFGVAEVKPVLSNNRGRNGHL